MSKVTISTSFLGYQCHWVGGEKADSKNNKESNWRLGTANEFTKVRINYNNGIINSYVKPGDKTYSVWLAQENASELKVTDTKNSFKIQRHMHVLKFSDKASKISWVTGIFFTVVSLALKVSGVQSGRTIAYSGFVLSLITRIASRLAIHETSFKLARESLIIQRAARNQESTVELKDEYYNPTWFKTQTSWKKLFF